MKTLISITFTLIICTISHAQVPDTLNRIDELGRKQGHWIYYGKDRPESGIPLDGKVEEGNYINDRKEGMWIRYHRDGVTIKLIGEYANNRPKGYFEKFYTNGQLREQGFFEKNHYYGALKNYYDNGILKSDMFFDSLGKPHGQATGCYLNGENMFVKHYRNGILCDSSIAFYPNGDPQSIAYYDKKGDTLTVKKIDPVNPLITPPHPGKWPKSGQKPWEPNNDNLVLDKKGNCWISGEFRNGKLWTGKVYHYSDEGFLQKIQLFRDGIYMGDQ